jgi:hypothetical protein
MEMRMTYTPLDKSKIGRKGKESVMLDMETGIRKRQSIVQRTRNLSEGNILDIFPLIQEVAEVEMEDSTELLDSECFKVHYFRYKRSVRNRCNLFMKKQAHHLDNKID